MRVKPNLYLDLDGVMFDFDGHCLNRLGGNPKTFDDQEMWDRLNNLPDFFETMPLFPGALDFYLDIKQHFNVSILTACPKSFYAKAAKQKIANVRKSLCSDVRILPVMGGRNKVLFMHKPGEVLIDDWSQNTDAWVTAGGRAILHKNFTDTTIKLYQMFNKAL